MLKDPDAIMRQGAAYALGVIKDAHAVAPLIAALNDPIAGVRQNAAEALVKIADPHGADVVLMTLKTGKVKLTIGIYRGIKQYESVAEDILIAALARSDDSDVAEEFLNTGSEEQKAAARKWADAHGYAITRFRIHYP